MLWGVKWYLWLILLAAIIGLFFAWRKALKTSKERRERMKKEAEIWKKDYELRQGFKVLTKEKLSETSDSDLLHGVAMNIQVFLENSSNMNEEFNNLPKEKKCVYALEYFDEDAKNKLSLFFKNNGEPLTPIIPEALKEINCEKYLSKVEPMLKMYDSESDVSIDYPLIEKLDEEFSEIYNSNELLVSAAKYIRKNQDIFIN